MTNAANTQGSDPNHRACDRWQNQWMPWVSNEPTAKQCQAWTAHDFSKLEVTLAVTTRGNFSCYNASLVRHAQF